MFNKKSLIQSAACSIVFCGGVLFAQGLQAPVVNIGTRHGNLRSAQQDIVSAFQKINRAQTDNQDQLGGHAQRAKDYLAQADQELRLAANVSNAEGR